MTHPFVAFFTDTCYEYRRMHVTKNRFSIWENTVRRILVWLCLACLLLGEVPTCPAAHAADGMAQETEEKGAHALTTVTDVYGRRVQLPHRVRRLVCTGSGALRLVSYLGAAHLLAGVERSDQLYAQNPRRDYAFALHGLLAGLPVIGKGGGTSYTAYPEAMLQAAPDVILTGYSREATEQLARETGLPVVAVYYRSINFVDESFSAALRLTASLLGREQRAEELLAYIDSCRQELHRRTRDIPPEGRPTVYTGAVTHSGAHGFAGTYSRFGPFTAVHAVNVADDPEREGYYEADLETVLHWNPDIIFLDPGNMHLVNREYAARPDYFQSLGAVRSGRIYTMPSFNNYSTNITYCLIDAYFAGKILYPERFEDIVMPEKGNEILKYFLGRGFFADMAAGGLYYGSIRLGQ